MKIIPPRSRSVNDTFESLTLSLSFYPSLPCVPIVHTQHKTCCCSVERERNRNEVEREKKKKLHEHVGGFGSDVNVGDGRKFAFWDLFFVLKFLEKKFYCLSSVFSQKGSFNWFLVKPMFFNLQGWNEGVDVVLLRKCKVQSMMLQSSIISLQ